METLRIFVAIVKCDRRSTYGRPTEYVQVPEAVRGVVHARVGALVSRAFYRRRCVFGFRPRFTGCGSAESRCTERRGSTSSSSSSEMPRTSERRRSVFKVGLLSPTSKLFTTRKAMPLSAATSSCVFPASHLAFRMRSPRATRKRENCTRVTAPHNQRTTSIKTGHLNALIVCRKIERTTGASMKLALVLMAAVGCGGPQLLSPVGNWSTTWTWGQGNCSESGTSTDLITVIQASSNAYGLSDGTQGTTITGTMTCGTGYCLLSGEESGATTDSQNGNEITFTAAFNFSLASSGTITGSGTLTLSEAGSSCQQAFTAGGRGP